MLYFLKKITDETGFGLVTIFGISLGFMLPNSPIFFLSQHSFCSLTLIMKGRR